MIKRVLVCVIFVSLILFSGCGNAGTPAPDTNSDTKASTQAGLNQANDKGDIEMQLTMANDRITQLESEIKGNQAYTKELEKEIELINSFTKGYTNEHQLSIARKQWRYNLYIDDKQIAGSAVEIDRTNFKVSLSEEHDVLPLVPMEVFNSGKIAGDITEHIKFNNYKPDSIQEPAGGFVQGFVYEFNNVPHGTSIEMEISKELQDRLGMDADIININVK